MNVPWWLPFGSVPEIGPADLALALAAKEPPVLLDVRSAHRSPPAVRLLRRAGVDARQLAGGMLAWRHAGKPVVR